MPRSGKTLETGATEAFDFSLATKRQLEAQKRELAFARSETLDYELQRMQDKIDWNALGQASTEDEVKAALSSLDQVDRDRLPSFAAILATVQDPKYPKLRPIRFLSESCALALQTNPKSADVYSPRYSHDICYTERKRRGPAPKQTTDLEYWRAQAEVGRLVPVRFLRKINKQEANEKRNYRRTEKRGTLTYTDIPSTMASVKKRRTTVWLPETTLAKLKKLSDTTGAPMAELFRRAVEAYLTRS
jgi:hypothetical protein